MEATHAETRKNKEIVVVITRKITEGKDEEYELWLQKIKNIESQQKGFISHEHLVPIDGYQQSWTSIIRFDTRENLEQWMSSAQQKQIVEEVKKICSNVQIRSSWGVYEGLFRDPNEPNGKHHIPTWKMTLTIILSLYPTVYLISHAFSWLVESWPFAIKLLFMNTVAVIVMSWVSLPFVKKIIDKWLVRDNTTPNQAHFIGGAGIVITIIVMCFIFNAIEG